MKWKYLTIFFLILSILSISGQAKTIDFKEFYYDYQGNAHEVTNQNLVQYPYFIQSENASNRYFSSVNDTITIPKSMDVQIFPTKISPSMTFPKTLLASKMVNYNATVGYLVFPYSLSRIKDYSDEHNIKLGRWAWDNGITVIGENDTNLSSQYYDFKIVNDEMRLYFNKSEANKLQGNITFQMNSWTIGNTTFWNNTDCGSGYWSAYGDGSCGTPLSDSIHTNLSGYWDMESTAGTIEHGINKFGRFPNSSIQGTWNGNTTINYTVGKLYGNAVRFDGVNDYINLGNSGMLGQSKTKTIYVLFKIYALNTWYSIYTKGRWDILAQTFAYLKTNSNLVGMYLSDTSTSHYRYTSTALGANTWYNGMSLLNSTLEINTYLNDVLDEGAEIGTGNPLDSSANAYIAANFDGSQYYLNGSIDEFVITTDGLPILSSSMYSTSWNMTFPNNTASAGNIINAVKFNISNLNVQGNSANISVRQNGTANWTLINSSYITDTWINQTYWAVTDFKVDVYGNGSSRAFIISMTYDEGAAPTLPTYILNGTVNNSLGAPLEWAKLSWNGINVFSNDSGYYEFLNATNGTHTLTAQQIGYDNYSESFNLGVNTTKNITMTEKEAVSEDTMITYSMVGALFGGVLTFLLIRKKKKRYERI